MTNVAFSETIVQPPPPPPPPPASRRGGKAGPRIATTTEETDDAAALRERLLYELPPGVAAEPSLVLFDVHSVLALLAISAAVMEPI